MKINPYKTLVGSLLVVALFVILFVKIDHHKKDVSNDAVLTESPITAAIGESNNSPDEIEKTNAEQKQNQPAIDKETLALVNHFKISQQYLNDQFQSLPAEYREEFKNDLEGFLDQLIVRELLFQHAEQQGFTRNVTITDPEQAKDVAIQNFLKDLINHIQVSETEMKSFYDEHSSEMRGASFEQVKANIKDYLVQQKHGELVSQTIERLKKEAQIIYNEQWLNEQRALKPPNPLEAALNSGKPTVLDLGAGSCIPCKMMKPIFAELEQSMKGKANIILLEISEHRDLAQKYRVRVIPTQIFFDASGEVYWRHEGFLPKQQILNKLRELGVK